MYAYSVANVASSCSTHPNHGLYGWTHQAADKNIVTGTSKIIGSIGLKETQDYTWEFGEAVFDSYVFAASETVGQAEEILSSDSELEER